MLARRLKDLCVNLIDVSSGGLVPKGRIPVGKGYQVPFARRIRDEAEILTGAVGMITEPQYANEIITGGDADLVFLPRDAPAAVLDDPGAAGAGRRAELADPVWLCRPPTREVEAMAILPQPKLTPSSRTELRKPIIRYQRGSEPWPGVCSTLAEVTPEPSAGRPCRSARHSSDGPS